MKKLLLLSVLCTVINSNAQFTRINEFKYNKFDYSLQFGDVLSPDSYSNDSYRIDKKVLMQTLNLKGKILNLTQKGYNVNYGKENPNFSFIPEIYLRTTSIIDQVNIKAAFSTNNILSLEFKKPGGEIVYNQINNLSLDDKIVNSSIFVLRDTYWKSYTEKVNYNIQYFYKNDLLVSEFVKKELVDKSFNNRLDITESERSHIYNSDRNLIQIKFKDNILDHTNEKSFSEPIPLSFTYLNKKLIKYSSSRETLIFSYGLNEKLQKISSSMTVSPIMLSYDGSNNLIEEKRGDIAINYTLQQGNIVKIIETNNEIDAGYVITHNYNDNGDKISEIQNPLKNDLRIRYEINNVYKYDKVGNWITKTIFLDGEPYGIIRREIVYE